jgi:hypothetical protein
MTRVDERIREEMRELERPAGLGGVLERVAQRKRRRRVVRRIQGAALAVAVVGGSVAGGLGLTRLFAPEHGTTPGAHPSPSAPGPNPTSAGGSPQEEQMLCDQTQISADVDGDGALDQVDVYSPSPISSCDAPEVGQRYVLHVSGGKYADHVGPDVNFYGVDQWLPECQQPHTCRLFAAPDVNGDGQAEIAVQIEKGASSFFFDLYELEGLDTAAGVHLVRIDVAQPGDPDSGLSAGPSRFAWGGDADRLEAVECRGEGPDRILVASNAVPSAGHPGRYDVREVQLSFHDGTLRVEAAADYPNLEPDRNPPFETPPTLCGSPLVQASN